jgi:hypothetical protein
MEPEPVKLQNYKNLQSELYQPEQAVGCESEDHEGCVPAALDSTTTALRASMKPCASRLEGSLPAADEIALRDGGSPDAQRPGVAGRNDTELDRKKREQESLFHKTKSFVWWSLIMFRSSGTHHTSTSVAVLIALREISQETFGIQNNLELALPRPGISWK